MGGGPDHVVLRRQRPATRIPADDGLRPAWTSGGDRPVRDQSAAGTECRFVVDACVGSASFAGDSRDCGGRRDARGAVRRLALHRARHNASTSRPVSVIVRGIEFFRPNAFLRDIRPEIAAADGPVAEGRREGLGPRHSRMVGGEGIERDDEIGAERYFNEGFFGVGHGAVLRRGGAGATCSKTKKGRELSRPFRLISTPSASTSVVKGWR